MMQIAAGGRWRTVGLLWSVALLSGCAGCRHRATPNDGPADLRGDVTIAEHVADAVDAADTAGFPALLAPDSEGPAGIAVDDAYVYWANCVSGKIWRIGKTGGTAQLLCTVARTGVIDIAVDDNFVYLTAPADLGAASVGLLRVRKSGGSVEVVSAQEFNPHSLAIDGGELFWMTGTVDAPGGPRKMDLANKQVTRWRMDSLRPDT